MYHGELIIASGNNLAVTNHSVFGVEQKFDTEQKVLRRTCYIEAQKLFQYDGLIEAESPVEGIIRLQIGDKEELKYFTGIMLSLNMGLARIRLTGELQDQNVQQFLKQIERYEFSR